MNNPQPPTNPVTHQVAGFFVAGDPKPQGSMTNFGKGRMTHSNPKMKAWRDKVQTEANNKWAGQEPLDEPVEVCAVFYLPKLKKPRFPLPATGYDTDKLQRAIGDALERAGVLKNDARICDWSASKRYATDTQPPGVYIQIAKDPANDR